MRQPTNPHTEQLRPDNIGLIHDADWYNQTFLTGDPYEGLPEKHYRDHGISSNLPPSAWAKNSSFTELIKSSGIHGILEIKLSKLDSLGALPGALSIITEDLRQGKNPGLPFDSRLKDILSISPSKNCRILDIAQHAFGLAPAELPQFNTLAEILHSLRNPGRHPFWFNPTQIREINPDLCGLPDQELYFYILENLTSGRPLDKFHHFAPTSFRDLLRLKHIQDNQSYRQCPSQVSHPMPSKSPNSLGHDPHYNLQIGIVVFNPSRFQLNRVLGSIKKAYEIAVTTHGTKLGQCGITIHVNSDEHESTKAISAMPSNHPLEVSVISSKNGNVGFGVAHNNIVKSLRLPRLGLDIYIAVNPDGALHPESISNLLSHVEHEGIEESILEFIQAPVPHPKYYNPNTLETSWVSGACFAISVEKYISLGGFDESLFLYSEDIDLSIRARTSGLCLRTLPKCIFWHDTSSRDSTDRELPMKSSAVYLARKHCQQKYMDYFKIMKDSPAGQAITSIQLAQMNLSSAAILARNNNVDAKNLARYRAVISDIFRNGLHFGTSRSFK